MTDNLNAIKKYTNLLNYQPMKTNNFLYPLLLALALTGCTTNEDGPINKGEEEQGQERYLAVSIVTPKEPGVRADDTNADDKVGFESGSAEEDAAETASFVLLDATDNVYSVVKGVKLSPWSGLGGNYDSSVENVSTAVLVVKGVSENQQPPKIRGILAILNDPGLDITAAKGENQNNNLAKIKEIVGTYGTTGASGSFLMTNSVYADGGNIKIAADVTEDQFADNPEEAKANPVKIYVERAVAKITTAIGTEGFVSKMQSVQIDGESDKTNLDIRIRGIQIANCADQSYAFKNIEGLASTAPWESWNDPANKRSYWANMPTTGITYTNHSWNQISGVGQGNTALSYVDPHTFYVQENVVPSSSTASPQQHTSVIVTAQLMKQGTDEPLEFVQVGGIYYKPEDGLIEIANRFANRHYYIKTTSGNTTTYKNIPPEYLEWATEAPENSDFKGWEGYAKLKNANMSETYYQYVDDVGEGESHYQERTAAQINTALQEKALRALKWTNGMCYYFVDIEHFGEETIGTEKVKRKGIIRNHLYKLTLRRVEGLGVPVFNADEVIIPENPPQDKLFYLGASINILKWTIVGQQIEFNN